MTDAAEPDSSSNLAPAPPRSWWFAALLAALAMLGPFAIDMYLPAFHAIGAEFGVSPIAVQQTLSTYLFAYAFMMLWHGALSDALGRRPVVIASLAVYALASLGCAIAGNVQSLWLFRSLQGLSAGAGLVVGRAIIRDRYHGPEAQRLMSQITLVFGIAPALAPVVGGLLLNTLGWRSIFWMMLVLVGAVLVWTAVRLPETLPRARRQPIHPRILWHSYLRVLRKRDFLLLAAIPTLNFAAIFLYIATAPRYLVDLLGVSTYGFAWLFIPLIAGIMLGALLSGRLAGRLSSHRTIGLGYAFIVGGASLNLLVAAFVPPSVPWHVLPLFVFATGTSTVMPSVTLLMLDLFPEMRGLVSSLAGSIQFAFSGFNAGTVAPLLAHSLSSLALGMATLSVASLGLWVWYAKEFGPFGRL